MPKYKVILFGPFEPGAQLMGLPGMAQVPMLQAAEFWPIKTGYISTGAYAAWGNAGVLAATCRGADIQVSAANVWEALAGTASNIYRTVNGTWTSVGSGYSLTAGTGIYWHFARFGSKVIAVGRGVAPQVRDIDSGGSFAALGGSPPNADGVTTVGDFVFLWGLSSDRTSLQWSAINNITGWTPGTGLSDTQTFPDGGDIVGVTPGDKTGFVLQKRGIRAYQFLPGDTATIFQFSKIDGAPGCIGPKAWCTIGPTVYYASDRGFYSLGPGGLRPIGEHTVNKYYLDDFHAANRAEMVVAADIYSHRIVFSYLRAGSAYRQLIYDYILDRWSEDIKQAEFWLPAPGADDPTNAHDAGFGLIVSGVLTFQKIIGGTRPGGDLTTVFLQLESGRRSTVLAVRPITDGLTASVSIRSATAFVSGEALPSVTQTTQETNGRYSFKVDNAYHKFTLSTFDGNTATFYSGLEIWYEPSGEA